MVTLLKNGRLSRSILNVLSENLFCLTIWRGPEQEEAQSLAKFRTRLVKCNRSGGALGTSRKGTAKGNERLRPRTMTSRVFLALGPPQRDVTSRSRADSWCAAMTLPTSKSWRYQVVTI
nr:uncharacterized protein LOC118878564 [Drosophila suzukii]